MPLFIRLPDQAEVMAEEIMALQPQELAGEHPASLLDHLRDGNLGVVVGNPLRHAAEEFKCPAMALLECLGAFAGKDLAEYGIAVQKRQDEHGDLPLLAAIKNRRLAKVDLGLARSMRQRHEDFCRPPLPPPNLFLDNSPATAVALLAQPLEDPLGRVPLLWRRVFVSFQNLVDQRHERPEHRLRPRLLPPIARRLLVLKDLLQRVPMQFILLACLSLRQLAGQHQATHFTPSFHVGVHSRLPRGGVGLVAVVPLQALLTPPRVRSRAPRFSTGTPSPSRATLFNRRLQGRGMPVRLAKYRRQCLLGAIAATKIKTRSKKRGQCIPPIDRRISSDTRATNGSPVFVVFS